MHYFISLFMFIGISTVYNQTKPDPVIQAIVNEAMNNSQLERLAHELLDGIGPRLTGSPQMKQANDWLIATYKKWGIQARNEEWGKWRGWQRGISHIDLINPRRKALEGKILAWSPGTDGQGIEAGIILIPNFKDSIDFANWLPSVTGKIVLVSMLQPTGRPDQNWEEFATKESFEKMKQERLNQQKEWNQNLRKSGLPTFSFSDEYTLYNALEDAGAVAVVGSNWTKGFGSYQIHYAYTRKVPMIDLALEDYGMVYRLALSGKNPMLRITAESDFTSDVPAYNTIAELKGNQKSDQYVILSAHLDSWDGASGATDNGTGTIVMMEAMRILKKVYLRPNRTLLVGHWDSEEQGLNGARAYADANPEIMDKVQAVFNQDNGTGRVISISGQGFMKSEEFVGAWLKKVPNEITQHIKTEFPGIPYGEDSDYSAFVTRGIPAFDLNSIYWSYFTYTWHTNRDTYDKLVWDELKNNVILVASLVYLASEDPRFFPRDKRTQFPENPRTGKPYTWPEKGEANKRGRLRN